MIISKRKKTFIDRDCKLVLFTYEQGTKYGIATININDGKLHKVYKTDEKTKFELIEKSKKLKCTNIINASNGEHTSFTIIFNENDNIADFPLTQSKQGGGKIRSKNNRNRNRTTKYKKNKSIRNKKYYRISRRK